MLVHRGMKSIDNGTRVQAPVALRLRLNCVVQRGQAGPGAGVHDQSVKSSVEIEYLSRRATMPLGDCKQFLIDFVELCAQIDSIFPWHLGDASTSETLKVTDN